MKNSLLQFEPTQATKALQLATRKAPRLLGGRCHPGLVHTANPERDVALTVTAFLLEAVSLVLLWCLLPFHPGMVAGLAAFDTAGALLMHMGVADENLRRARICAAESPEEHAAIDAQRPRSFRLLRILGIVCVVLPFLYKVASILMLPMALHVLGGFAPALFVSFTAVAAIHLFFTGYGLAHLRYRLAESRERQQMLRSDSLASGRATHQNRIKAARKYRFQSFEPLKDVLHSDGHSLRREGVAEVGGCYYVLTTWGRFDDPDLDFMVNAQQDFGAKAELALHGLRQQLIIEQSEPLSSSEANTTIPSKTEQHQMEGVAGEDLKQPVFRAAAILLATASFGLTGCGPEKPEKLNVTIVATKPLPCDMGLPVPVLQVLAPAKPLAGKFVPTGELVRLDLTDRPTENLAPVFEASEATKMIESSWKIESAEIELAKAAEALGKHGPGLAAKSGPSVSAAEISNRLAEVVLQAQAEGREVVAVSRAAKDGQVRLSESLTVPARPLAKEVYTLIEEKLKAGATASVLVLLDPPVFGQPIPAKIEVEVSPLPSETKLEGETNRGEPTGMKPETEPAISIGKEETSMGGAIDPRFVAVPGSSVTVNVQPGTTTIGAGPSASLARFTLPASARAVGEPLRFEKNQARLTPDARRALATIVTKLRAQRQTRVILVGSADHTGNPDLNDRLARERADVVRAALLRAGIVADSISVGANLADETLTGVELQQDRTVSVYVADGVVTL